MKVRDLHRELTKLIDKGDGFSELKIAVFRSRFNAEDLDHLTEPYSGGRNTVSCYLSDIIFAWTTSNKQVILIDTGSAQNTVSFRDINQRIMLLKERCKRLDPHSVLFDITRTAGHQGRNKEELAIDAIVDHRFKSHAENVDVNYEGGCFFFDLIHSVSNGIGTRDRAQIPSIEGLENLIEVLEALKNGR